MRKHLYTGIWLNASAHNLHYNTPDFTSDQRELSEVLKDSFIQTLFIVHRNIHVHSAKINYTAILHGLNQSDRSTNQMSSNNLTSIKNT